MSVVGLGLVTYNRPEYFAQVAASVRRHLVDQVDYLCVYNDGSDRDYSAAYAELPENCTVIDSSSNQGVGHAKTVLLGSMYRAGCDWMFVLEDDVCVTSPLAITGYLAAAQESGHHHLSFHLHGPANAHGQPEPAPPEWPTHTAVTYWRQSVGAYCLYSRESYRKAGAFDPHFRNAWEHVEHSMRIAAAGMTTGFPHFADATGSEAWLAEIPGSINHSAIRQDADWRAGMEEGKRYWKRVRPDTYYRIWPI